MKFNFIIIPLVIALTVYIGSYYTKQGLKDWYKHIKKPKWTPHGGTIAEIWIFLYSITGFAIMWFWNVPAFHWWFYIIGAVLLVNAFLNAYWNKVFFVEHNFRKSYKYIRLLNLTSVIAAIGIFPFSHIAALLLLPYIVWVAIATMLTKEIWYLNKHQSHH